MYYLIKENSNNTTYGDYSSYTWTINYTNGRKHTLCSALALKKKASNYSTRENNSNKKQSNINNNKRSQLNPAERKKVRIRKY